MQALLALLAVTVLALAGPPASAAENPYHLTPTKIAPDTYVFLGAMEDFSYANHGNIVNTGFIVTDEGVVVIDTGPSKLYGEAMRAAIEEVTDQPVVQVYITHHHPDHFLGNQAFDDVPIAALAGTVNRIRQIGGDLAGNLYNLVGGAMRGTRAVAPDQILLGDTQVRFGGHQLQLIASGGHTDADLAVFDRSTGVLFAGDLAFFGRAPTTPDADVARWLNTLEALGGREFKLLVPGHGPVADTDKPLLQTSAYLTWLLQDLNTAARNGLSMPEAMFQPLPARWGELAVMPVEFRRSVAHLYPAIEREVLPTVSE